jgi:hypothetical protein
MAYNAHGSEISPALMAEIASASVSPGRWQQYQQQWHRKACNQQRKSVKYQWRNDNNGSEAAAKRKLK